MSVNFITIHASKINEFLRDIDAQEEDLIRELSYEMEATCIDIVRIAKQRVSKELGVLARSIGYVRKSTLNFSIVVGAQYAAFEEFGTSGISGSSVSVPAGFEEVAARFRGVKIDTGGLRLSDAIELWGARKGMERADIHGVYLKILHKGRNPHPFLIPAFVSETRKLEERLSTLLKK